MPIERKSPLLSDSLVNDKGQAEQRFFRYLADLPDIMEEISGLAGGATLADVIAKQNEILAELKAAKLMEVP